MIDDSQRLDALETLLKGEETISLHYTDAWSEVGEFGAVLSQGPEEFWIGYHHMKLINRTLREAIDAYIRSYTT